MEGNILSLEAMKNVYQIVATNLEITRKKQWDTKTPVPNMKLKEGYLFLCQGLYSGYVRILGYTEDS